MADRIVVLQSGTVQQYDTPEAVYERPANQFVAGFIGSPTMNFFPVEWRGDDVAFSQTVRPAPLDDKSRASAAPGRESACSASGPSTSSWPPMRPTALRVPIKLVEPLGSDTLIHFDLAGRPRLRASIRRCGRRSVTLILRPQPGKTPSVRCRPTARCCSERARRPLRKVSAAADLAPRARGIRVICLGLSALDQVWRVDGLFRRRQREDQEPGIRDLGGGMAANAAVTAARLGGSTAFWGRGGDDAAGHEMRTALAAEGVDVANFRLFPDGRSSVSGIIVDRSGERQIVNFRGQFPDRSRLAAAR